MKLNTAIRNEILDSMRKALNAQPLKSADPHEAGLNEHEYFKRQKAREEEVKARREEIKVTLQRAKVALTFYKDDEELQNMWPRAYEHWPQWCYQPVENINVPSPVSR